MFRLSKCSAPDSTQKNLDLFFSLSKNPSIAQSHVLQAGGLGSFKRGDHFFEVFCSSSIKLLLFSSCFPSDLKPVFGEAKTANAQAPSGLITVIGPTGGMSKGDALK